MSFIYFILIPSLLIVISVVSSINIKYRTLFVIIIAIITIIASCFKGCDDITQKAKADKKEITDSLSIDSLKRGQLKMIADRKSDSINFSTFLNILKSKFNIVRDPITNSPVQVIVRDNNATVNGGSPVIQQNKKGNNQLNKNGDNNLNEGNNSGIIGGKDNTINNYGILPRKLNPKEVLAIANQYSDKNISIRFVSYGFADAEINSIRVQITKILKTDGFNNIEGSFRVKIGGDIPEKIFYIFYPKEGVLEFHVPPATL